MIFKINTNNNDSKKPLKYNEKVLQARKNLEDEYKKELNSILKQLTFGEKFLTKQEQIKRFYDWFTKNIEFDHNILKNSNGTNFSAIIYHYKDCDITCDEKYAPILLHKGVCKSFSTVFKDFCALIGVNCRIVRGRDDDVIYLKNAPHQWNEVFLDGKWSTVDLTPPYQVCMGRMRTRQNNSGQNNMFVIKKPRGQNNMFVIKKPQSEPERN